MGFPALSRRLIRVCCHAAHRCTLFFRAVFAASVRFIASTHASTPSLASVMRWYCERGRWLL
jgi:hypothetical protein